MCVYVKLAKSVPHDGHKMEKISFLCVWFIFSANYCSHFPSDIPWVRVFRHISLVSAYLLDLVHNTVSKIADYF